MFWHLFLAHLVGDYPLQSEWLIENKRSLWGLSLHTAIHLALMLLVVGAASVEAWPKILVLALIHFLLDLTKSRLFSRWPEHARLHYVVDQILHILSIFLVAQWIVIDLHPVLLPISTTWTIYSIGYLMVTYVWYITEKLFTEHDEKYQKELERHFWSRMVTRAVLLTLFLFAGQSLEIAAGAMAFRLPYTEGPYRRRALLVDISVALVIAVFVLLAS
jgi:hypothetical protein